MKETGLHNDCDGGQCVACDSDRQVTRQNKALPRFVGATIWSTLSSDDQAAIGAIALELVINMLGDDTYFSGTEAEMPAARPFIAAQPLLTDLLIETAQSALHETVPAIDDDTLPVPIPSLLGQVCRACLCSEADPCDEGCGWAEPDLCTACARKAS